MPLYPRESLKNRVKGVVVAELQHDGTGRVTELRILQSPDSWTGKAVSKAVISWLFLPIQYEGRPVSVRGKITFYFEIDSKGRGQVKNPKQFAK